MRPISAGDRPVAVLRLLPLSLFLLCQPLAAQSHGGGSSANGTVERHVDIVYYPVEGVTVGDLARSLQARGPVNDGERYFGQTDWTINAEYVWVEVDTGCRVEDLVVRVAITITLPRWEPTSEAPIELVGAWRRFVRALAAHEHNHRRLAEEAADAIRWDLATRRYPSCQHADARSRQRVVDIIDEYSRRNRVYDQRTRHGTTEGAVWPPPKRIGADTATPR